MEPSETPSVSVFHNGCFYDEYLKQIHKIWKPSNYLEIGCSEETLIFAGHRAVAIGPEFKFQGNPVGQRVETYFFQLTSDKFFAQHDLKKFLPDGIDFAFLNGNSSFEYVLRDFLNTEKYSKADTIFAVQNCYPVNSEMANREPNFDHRSNWVTRFWWCNDRWKLLRILRKLRPDLKIVVLDCRPAGLVLIQNLAPNSRSLSDTYDEIVKTYQDITMETFGFEQFRNEFPTSNSRFALDPETMQKFLTSRSERPETIALRNLSNRVVLGKDHIEYLMHMRDTLHVDPEVIYDIGACVLHWQKGARTVWPNARFVLFEAMEEVGGYFPLRME